MDPKKKILILYTSVGMGHKFIAENIGWHLSTAGFEVRQEDIGKVQEGKFSNSVIFVHQFINKRLPFIWSFLYHWGHYMILPFRVFIAGFNYKQTKKIVDEFKPDLIITVQTTASAVISFLKQKGLYKGPFGIAFSDFHLHRYWLYSQADFYLANIKEQKEEMIKLGIAPEKIFICGITLKSKPVINVSEVKSRLGIQQNEKVILISSGSLGSGIIPGLIAKFLALPNTKLIVVCGKNETVYRQLKDKYQNPRLIVFGFYKLMDELYAISDLFITKPGGLTTAEALRWHLPMIVSHWLPGQEELNILYLSKRNLIILGKKGLIEAATKETNTQNFRKSLENNFNLKAILEPQNSPKDVVSKVLNPQ